MKFLNKNLFLFLSVIIVDQLTKYWAVKELVTSWVVTSFLQFELFYNRGMSWGYFASEQYFFLIILVALLITAFLAKYIYNKIKLKKPVYAELLVLSGAISNIIDRFTYFGVVDFITLHFNGWYWPTFNIADACIVIGVLLMFFADE